MQVVEASWSFIDRVISRHPSIVALDPVIPCKLKEGLSLRYFWILFGEIFSNFAAISARSRVHWDPVSKRARAATLLPA